MPPYQHLFSANAVLNVWRNLRASRDQHDLLLTFQYQPDEVKARKFGDASTIEERETARLAKRNRDRAGDSGTGGRSIGFVVPWRSMQAQKRELREKEKELAEALVVLSGEVAFTELPDTLKASLSHNPLIQVRHIAAGISRQMSKIELQLAENAPFSRGKNLYTGGEIVRKFLPTIQTLFEQRPVPQRMIFELLMELKDLVFLGMVDCDKEVMEWELSNFTSFEDLDEAVVAAVSPVVMEEKDSRKKLKGKETRQLKSWLTDDEELLYYLENLETTASAMHHLEIDDFCAKSAITLRRMLDRKILNEFGLSKKKRTEKCAEYARCMKWAETSWRQGGGCRRGCKNEDEDPEGLPSWHSTSIHFDRNGTYMIGNGTAKEEEGRLKLGS
ncbi:hypothetical protein K469DRAFT_711390 [Zopfia rhizophila CBS 207.26]|uniref:Uncharacterized protein n=1 Tax=Zopfia rhizophila CBS 207.26 TaxID=1314779 RepID=A0A6A6DYJ3_9PEZI|nr:hypothetical protein K469DRAFT_711390 [Zopfia rhizophila CBS 207.26]